MMIKLILLSFILLVLLSIVDAGPCEDGYRAGKRRVARIWRREMHRDCDNIWELEDEGRRLKRQFRRRGNNNWRRRQVSAELRVLKMID